MNVLILLGSLRADSTNRRLAEAAIAHPPTGAHAHISTLPAALPFYDEDLDIPRRRTERRGGGGRADRGAPGIQWHRVRRAGERDRLGVPAARRRGDHRQAGPCARPHRRSAQWARDAAIRSLHIAGASPIASLRP